MYRHILLSDKITDVIDNPAFQGRGILLFPWDDPGRYTKDMTMADTPRLHLWHTAMDARQMLDGVNRLIDDINEGKTVLYDIYTQDEKQKTPEKKRTGLFFFRGKPGAPFAVICPGGGYYYVGSLHAGFPAAMELNRYGYNAFVLNYRVGGGIPAEHDSGEDLIAAVHFILEHAEELQVDPDGYAVGGESAGARICSNVCYGEAGFRRPEDLIHPAVAVIAYVFFEGKPRFQPDDPAAFFIVGKKDHLVPWREVERRARTMERAGVDVELHILEEAPHGFAVGKGTVAEGWIEQAVRFWERHRQPDSGT